MDMVAINLIEDMALKISGKRDSCDPKIFGMKAFLLNTEAVNQLTNGWSHAALALFVHSRGFWFEIPYSKLPILTMSRLAPIYVNEYAQVPTIYSV